MGFSHSMYTVQESVGQVLLTVLVVPDENKVIPEITMPLGVRVTSRSGSATGKKHKFYKYEKHFPKM